MHPLQRSILICILLFASYVHVHAAEQFTRVSDKKGAALAEVVQSVAGADVLFVGEIHYNPQHHTAQLDLVRSLHAKKFSVAIGLEMFTPEDQQQLDAWAEGKLDEETFKPIYARNWSYGWHYYRDLFIFARDNRIPLIALNIPKGVIAKVVAQGSTALKESELPPKVSWKLNEQQADYMEIIARQVFGDKPPDKLFARFCEAQALRNNGMAWHIAQYKKTHQADTVVVLAGTWHAVKNGVPEQLATYGKFTYKVIMPELTEFNLENATTREADYLIMKQR